MQKRQVAILISSRQVTPLSAAIYLTEQDKSVFFSLPKAKILLAFSEIFSNIDSRYLKGAEFDLWQKLVKYVVRSLFSGTMSHTLIISQSGAGIPTCKRYEPWLTALPKGLLSVLPA
jgi:hypothetical protein